MFSWHIIRFRLVCLALALSGGGAFAQVNATDSAFQKFYAQVTGVGKQTVGYGSGGQLVVGQGVPQISTAGGPVLVDRALPIRNNSGGQIAANARISVPPAVLGRILRAGLAATPILGVGVALYDAAVEAGFTPSNDGGQLVITKPATVSPTAYDPISGTGNVGNLTNCPSNPATWTTMGFCISGSVGQSPWTVWGYVTTQQKDQLVAQGWTWASNNGSVHRVRLIYNSPMPDRGDSEPVTEQEFIDAIAAKSGWPSGSRVSQAVADATALQPAEPFTATPEVSGPATSTGTTTTTENPDGSTTTTTTTHNHTYTGPTINTTTQTITSTCTGGSCNTTTTTETPKVEEQPFTMPCGVAGTPPCDVRLDQSGMPPDGGRPFDQASGEVDPERDSLLSKLSEIEDFELGEWTWTFQLPTGCTPLTMFLGVEVNPCAWQDEIHDIMSVIWILTGIAGAFVIFSRAFQ